MTDNTIRAAAVAVDLSDQAKRLLSSVASCRINTYSLPVSMARNSVTATLDDAADLARAILRRAAHHIPDASNVGEVKADAVKSVAVELSSVAETLENGDGFWQSCSGCHETEDGHPVGDYPYSDILKCDLGGGCSECGGIGAVWDNTDYEAMGREFERVEAQSAEKFIYDDVCDERLRQDKQWGGDAHDDAHDLDDFMAYIVRQRKKAAVDIAGAQSIADEQAMYRQRFVKIAALAVAAMASIDRRSAPASSAGDQEVES